MLQLDENGVNDDNVVMMETMTGVQRASWVESERLPHFDVVNGRRMHAGDTVSTASTVSTVSTVSRVQ
jgi:hypothetical protein